MSSSALQSVSQIEDQINNNIDIERSFELWINRSLERRPELAKKINLVYQINIRLNSNKISTWILDLTEGTGALYRQPRHEVKCSITVDENDLLKVMADRSHWNKLFIERKLNMKGPRIGLEKLQQFWVEADNSNKDFQLIAIQSVNRNNENKNILDSINSNGFKSDIIFHTLRNRMHEEVDIVRKLTGIMEFEIIKNDAKSVWTIDFNQSLGENVYPGPPKDKPVCILTMDDEDFVKMMVNKLNPQKAFMMGKMKIRGQIMAIYKLFSVWIDAVYKKKRAPEVSYIEQILFSADLIVGLKSEIIVFQVIQRLIKCPKLSAEVDDIYYFDITKDGKLVSKWKLDLSAGNTFGVFSRQSIHVESPSETLIIIDDQDFALMALNLLNIESAMASKRIKGDISLAKKLVKIFQSPIIQSKL